MYMKQFILIFIYIFQLLTWPFRIAGRWFRRNRWFLPVVRIIAIDFCLPLFCMLGVISVVVVVEPAFLVVMVVELASLVVVGPVSLVVVVGPASLVVEGLLFLVVVLGH